MATAPSVVLRTQHPAKRQIIITLSIGSISAVFQNPFVAESFSASRSASDKTHLCNRARKSASIFERYFTEKIEFCTLFLNQSTRGCCKISSEAEIRRNQSVWRGKLAAISTGCRGSPEFFLLPRVGLSRKGFSSGRRINRISEHRIQKHVSSIQPNYSFLDAPPRGAWPIVQPCIDCILPFGRYRRIHHQKEPKEQQALSIATPEPTRYDSESD